MNVFLEVLFDFFYCDNSTNIYATLLIFNFITIVMVVTVQCCGNPFFNSIFLMV